MALKSKAYPKSLGGCLGGVHLLLQPLNQRSLCHKCAAQLLLLCAVSLTVGQGVARIDLGLCLEATLLVCGFCCCAFVLVQSLLLICAADKTE